VPIFLEIAKQKAGQGFVELRLRKIRGQPQCAIIASQRGGVIAKCSFREAKIIQH